MGRTRWRETKGMEEGRGVRDWSVGESGERGVEGVRGGEEGKGGWLGE